jgi:hypothetical protein
MQTESTITLACGVLRGEQTWVRWPTADAPPHDWEWRLVERSWMLNGEPISEDEVGWIVEADLAAQAIGTAASTSR